jgi:hypothetical protein
VSEDSPPTDPPAKVAMSDPNLGPQTLDAYYTTLERDQRVDLYEGPVRLSAEGNEAECEGSIYLDWEPVPRISFDFLVPLQWASSLEAPFEVDIELLGDIRGGRGVGTVLGEILRMDFAGGETYRKLTGNMRGAFEVGNPAPTASIIFHLPNFPNIQGTNIQSGNSTYSGRLTTVTHDWVIDLDAVPHRTELWAEAATKGGYGIAHVGRIQSRNHDSIDYEIVPSLVENVLYRWFSVLRGGRSSPVLLCGVHNGVVAWERWQTPSVSPWIGWRGWLPRYTIQPLGPQSTPDFGRILQALQDVERDLDLGPAINRAINWYTQALETQHLATRVVLAQAGLELMSWLRVVGDIGLSEESFKSMDTSDAVRLALNNAAIDPAVPSEFPDLFSATAQAKGAQQLDGPGAIVEIRNGIVHPKRNQRLGEDDVVIQGGELAIRYLEMLLLHRLGYVGVARNRVHRMRDEFVPWASNPDANQTP